VWGSDVSKQAGIIGFNKFTKNTCPVICHVFPNELPSFGFGGLPARWELSSTPVVQKAFAQRDGTTDGTAGSTTTDGTTVTGGTTTTGDTTTGGTTTGDSTTTGGTTTGDSTTTGGTTTSGDSTTTTGGREQQLQVHDNRRNNW
jgi:hypothetical protein